MCICPVPALPLPNPFHQLRKDLSTLRELVIPLFPLMSQWPSFAFKDKALDSQLCRAPAALSASSLPFPACFIPHVLNCSWLPQSTWLSLASLDLSPLHPSRSYSSSRPQTRECHLFRDACPALKARENPPLTGPLPVLTLILLLVTSACSSVPLLDREGLGLFHQCSPSSTQKSIRHIIGTQ